MERLAALLSLITAGQTVGIRQTEDWKEEVERWLGQQSSLTKAFHDEWPKAKDDLSLARDALAEHERQWPGLERLAGWFQAGEGPEATRKALAERLGDVFRGRAPRSHEP